MKQLLMVDDFTQMSVVDQFMDERSLGLNQTYAQKHQFEGNNTINSNTQNHYTNRSSLLDIQS